MAQSKKTQELNPADQAGAQDQLVLNVSLGDGAYQLTNITVPNFLSNLPDGVVSIDQLVVRQTSSPDIPLSSNTAAMPGTIWWDSDFLYIAVANNQVKRAALTTF
jgi:hypothetical protein